MNWYEAVPSLTPLVAYDALSRIYYENNINYILSRLNENPEHWHTLLMILSYKGGIPYKYFRVTEAGYLSARLKLKSHLDLGENWLIYYCIGNKLNNIGLYYVNEAYNDMMACFYGTKRFKYGNIESSLTEELSISASNLDSLGDDELYDVAIQRSSGPSKSFLYIKGDVYPLKPNLLPQKIDALLNPGFVSGYGNYVPGGFKMSAMGAFAGNAEPAEIVKISDALKENMQALPDPTVNVVGENVSVGSGEKLERSEAYVNVVDDVEYVNIFSAHDFQYGVIEGTVHEVFPPNPQAPVSRRVICIDQNSNRAVKETWSREEDGYYIFTALNKNKKYTVLAYDHTGNFTAICCDNIAPQ